jgi:hypothetical protein
MRLVHPCSLFDIENASQPRKDRRLLQEHSFGLSSKIEHLGREQQKQQIPSYMLAKHFFVSPKNVNPNY